jgi:hypothetical protein
MTACHLDKYNVGWNEDDDDDKGLNEDDDKYLLLSSKLS